MANKINQRIASTKAVSLNGIEGSMINVEASISAGLASFSIVGLPDASLSESKLRVINALKSIGIRLGEYHITVNLAPASLPKRGSMFDLAIACAILGAHRVINAKLLTNSVIIGELGLDGRLHPVNGILPITINAKKAGFTDIFVPLGNKKEAELVDGMNVHAFGHIFEIVKHFGGKLNLDEEIVYEPVIYQNVFNKKPSTFDYSEVIGQNEAKNALLIAAAGLHNVIMFGPPGTGKSMLASRLPTIMPDLADDSAMEVTSIYSLLNANGNDSLIRTPPFESPHHTITAPALIGGGSGIIKPGSVSKAHNGVLFLDEAPEFSPRVLQTLRGPLESGEVIIDRIGAKAKYPAHFLLIMACNPCPCGFGNSLDGSISSKCKCTSLEQRRYISRLSGPLLDRVDIFTNVSAVKSQDFSHLSDDELNSHNMKQKVIIARDRAKSRLKNTPWTVNSQIPGSYIRKSLVRDPKIINSVSTAIDNGVISMRGADRLLRICLTIADLNERDHPNFDDISYALELKGREI